MADVSGVPAERRRRNSGFFLAVLLAGLASLGAGWGVGARHATPQVGVAAPPAAADTRQIVQLGLGEIIFPIRRGGSIKYLVAEIQLDLEQEGPAESAGRLVDPLREIALETLAEGAALTSLDRLESRQEELTKSLLRNMNESLGRAQIKELHFAQFTLRDLQE